MTLRDSIEGGVAVILALVLVPLLTLLFCAAVLLFWGPLILWRQVRR